MAATATHPRATYTSAVSHFGAPGHAMESVTPASAPAQTTARMTVPSVPVRASTAIGV